MQSEFRDIWRYIWWTENRSWKLSLVWDQRSKHYYVWERKKGRDKGECHGERQRQRFREISTQ